MAATPDVVMRRLDDTLDNHMATEKQIKGAFIGAGYGAKKVQKWWDFYTSPGVRYIRPVVKSGFPLKDTEGNQLYWSEYWPRPEAVE